MQVVKTRFAPSPTGYLHLGSIRTAIFNWLFAKAKQGKMFLRIEDTDTLRSKQEFIDDIVLSMQWLGLNWDGDIIFQSKRKEAYQKLALDLLKKNFAYEKEKAIFFKSLAKNTEDFVILKADGMATYHLAVVADDIYQDITHVIRGSDHLDNTAKHLMIYNALKIKPPKFIHVPMILGADGAKLSKRHGAVSVLEYRKNGYLAEAIFNYLVRLGWSHKNQEVFSIAELKKIFDIEKLGKSACIFDQKKLDWLNAYHLNQKSDQEILSLLKTDPRMVEDKKLLKIIHLLKSRTKTLNDLKANMSYFLDDQISYDKVSLEKYLTKEIKPSLAKLLLEIHNLQVWDEGSLEIIVRDIAEKNNIKAGELIQAIRVLVTGQKVSPGLFETMVLVGREKVLERINKHL